MFAGQDVPFEQGSQADDCKDREEGVENNHTLSQRKDAS
jgi:hypothetical protein